MRISFIIPFPDKTGGIAVVLEHASRLASMGHDVRVYLPSLPYGIYYNTLNRVRRITHRVRHFFRNRHLRGQGVAWFRKPIAVESPPMIASPFVRDADVVIATAWPTARSVWALPRRKGAKVYFIQGFETWNGEVPAVESTYRLPMRIITIAPWLTKLMKTRFGREVDAEIHNGVDLDFFKPPEMKPSGDPVVLMLYHTQELKGIPTGREAIRRLREIHPAVRVRMFGMPDFPDREPYVEYHRDPSPEALRDLYRDAHIFLSPSLNEGWHLPPMEAMACGCAVVATRVGCIPALDDGRNMLVAEPGDVETLFRHLRALVENPAHRESVATAGLATIRSHDWSDSTRRLEAALLRAAEGAT